MPAIISLIIILSAGYCFWLFLKTASPDQMGKFLAAVAIAFALITLIFLALSQRLTLACVLILATWPIMAGLLDQRRREITVEVFDDYDVDDVIENEDIEQDDIHPPKLKKVVRLKDDFQKST